MTGYRRFVPFLGVAAIFGIDVARSRPRRLALSAVLDESAHVLTALLAHRALGLPLSRSAALGTLLGATLLDLDHVPYYLGSNVLSRRTVRPVTHSLSSVLLVAVAALATPSRWRLAGLCAAFGVATQLVRDMGTGTVPLMWPANEREVAVPYGAYAGVLLAAATRIALDR